MDRLEEWRVFVEVAKRQSFAVAARELRRSPQAITRAIAALEARIGTRLLHRTTRSVSLTNEGAQYLDRCQRALAEMDLLEAPANADAELRGTLSVTAPVLFGQLHVVPLVAEFLALHLALDLRLTLVDRVVSLAEEGIDVGIRIGELPDSALRARLVGRVRSVVCASPGYLKLAGVPRDLESLTDHNCIAFTATTPLTNRWSFPRIGRSSANRERSIAVRSRLSVNTGQAAIDAALLGLGLVRVLSYQVDHLVKTKQLRVVLEAFEAEPVPVHLIQLPGVAARAATTFVELAADRLAARLRG